MIRGEVCWADYGVPFGSEPGFRRPAVIVQRNSFTKSGIKTVIVVPLTTNLDLAEAPANVYIQKEASGLPKDSTAVVSQMGVIDKARLSGRVSKLPDYVVSEIEAGVKLILELD